MSYGYLIVTSNPTTFLEKDRHHRFFLSEVSNNLYFYSRLEECNSLTIRSQGQSVLSDEGIKYLSNIAPPFYFIDFLLAHREGEQDIINACKQKIKFKEFEVIHIRKQCSFKINHLYEVRL